MNPKMEQMLKEIVDKFQKMAMFEQLGNEEKVVQILCSISEDEISLLETLAEQYLEIVTIIRELKEELKADISKES